MVKAPARSRLSEADPRVRRGYFECRFGQLHVHNAIPAGGGFDEGTPLLCVHHVPGSGRVFHKLSMVLARERTVYAPDLPGFGESDAPPVRPAIADYAAALGDFCETMRLRQIDVLGYLSGSCIAAELTMALSGVVRRLVCVGFPIATDAEREAFHRAPWPVQPAEDGSHLLIEWQRTLQARGTLPLEALAREFADKLYGGSRAWWGQAAALEYPARERLGRITQPTLVIRARDDAAAATRARELMPRARFVDFPAPFNEAFESAPESLTTILRDFLRG